MKEKYQLISIVDTTLDSLPYQLVVLYASSGFSHQELVTDLTKLLLSDMTIIVTGDFNFHEKDINAVTNYLKSRKMKQMVKWPTHKQGGRIDHCYVTENARVKITRYSPYYRKAHNYFEGK